MDHLVKRLFVDFGKDALLAELQAWMSRSCKFLLFLPHTQQVLLIYLISENTLVSYCCTCTVLSSQTLLLSHTYPTICNKSHKHYTKFGTDFEVSAGQQEAVNLVQYNIRTLKRTTRGPLNILCLGYCVPMVKEDRDPYPTGPWGNGWLLPT